MLTVFLAVGAFVGGGLLVILALVAADEWRLHNQRRAAGNKDEDYAD